MNDVLAMFQFLVSTARHNQIGLYCLNRISRLKGQNQKSKKNEDCVIFAYDGNQKQIMK